MKKLLMLITIFMVSMSANAQKNTKAIGVNLNYGSEISNMGIGAKFQYGITNAIRIEPAFNYYFKKDGAGLWDVNANVHYLFNVADKINVYPLVGIGYAHSKVEFSSDEFEGFSDYGVDDVSASEGNFCANFGTGIEYNISDKLAIGAELKYQLISNFNQFVIGIGATYKF